jgi:hypothetical protein
LWKATNVIKQLHPEFREAFNLTNVRVKDLAASVEMPRTTLGRLMAAPEVRVTPLIERRLKTLAGILWYPADRIFR